MSNSTLLYQIRSVEHGYPWGNTHVQVLRGLDLEVPRQSFVCLVGPSGSGKTTLLNLMGFLDRPEAGEIEFFGERMSDQRERDLERMRLTDIGFVFQAFYLLPTLTVLENTTYFLPRLGISGARARARGEEVLARIGLKDHLHKRPAELSGGQRQRVAIARALAKRPKVILADEPTANLDRATSETIISVFQDLQKTESTSFVFATHDTHLVSYADHVFELRDGQVHSSGRKA
ncbi:MAG: ABC transporter ATP-binding protein [Bdellovibrionaceae bacterium]|nr:ABC transporter ATP-binding protein [Pseudobdellovibrionaceae bacterium]